jgi:hypothetical protein
MNKDEALNDFMKRIEHYTECYVPMGDLESERSLSYMKGRDSPICQQEINAGTRQILCEHVMGFTNLSIFASRLINGGMIFKPRTLS